MNKIGKHFWYSLTLLLLFGTLYSCRSGSGGADGVEIGINFKKGDKYLYSTQVNQKINSFGTQMDQNMLMEMVYTYAADEGANKKLNITYDHVSMGMTTPMGQMQYDSRQEGAREPEFAFMDSLIGKSFGITVSPDGNILKVEGLSELMNAIAASADDATRMTLESQFSDTAVKLMMQNSFDIYPGKKVKEGESWTKSSVMSFSGVSVNMENTYTLKAVHDGKAEIAVVSQMNLPQTDMGGSAEAPMKLEMSGKQEGNLDVEIASGQILSGKTTQNINGKMSAGGQEFPMSITGDISISSKKL